MLWLTFMVHLTFVQEQNSSPRRTFNILGQTPRKRRNNIVHINTIQCLWYVEPYFFHVCIYFVRFYNFFLYLFKKNCMAGYLEESAVMRNLIWIEINYLFTVYMCIDMLQLTDIINFYSFYIKPVGWCLVHLFLNLIL